MYDIVNQARNIACMILFYFALHFNIFLIFFQFNPYK